MCLSKGITSALKVIRLSDSFKKFFTTIIFDIIKKDICNLFYYLKEYFGAHKPSI